MNERSRRSTKRSVPRSGGRSAKSFRSCSSAATHIRSGTWHVPIFRVMMVLGGGVKKGLDDQMDMVAATLGVEAQRG